MRLFEKQKQVTGRKRDESNGILTSDPFLEAVHFWPFETNKGILTSDLITGSDAILMGGAKITKKGAPNSPKGQQNYYNTQGASHMPPQQQQIPPHRKRSSSNHLQVRREEEEEDVEVFDSFLDTKMNGSYVIAGDFNGTCFSDPDLCKLNGMTIYTWLKIDAKELESTENALGRDAYILSTGGQSKKSRGFAFLWFHGKFVMVISTETKQWKLEIPKDKIKHDEWVQLSFVWNTDTLTGYQDGTKIGSTKGVAAERPEVQFTIMTIGRPNNAVDARFMMKMEMAYLTLWDKALEEKELDKSYENIKQKIDKTRRRSILEKHSTIQQHPLVNREMQN
ncbi:uncharacterized protein [Clytia hemisphaerica]|uniref:uncharacterized protein n=1 Tax=Clytia hemisphaerica TaxID=252671 RepID=UPI0034D544C5